jgi:hypothetical protein
VEGYGLGRATGGWPLEDVAVVEAAVLVEVVADRGTGGGEFLQGI